MADSTETMPAKNKGDTKKYGAYLKSVGGNVEAADAMFKIYFEAKAKSSSSEEDKIATQIEEALASLATVKTFKLGNKGYIIKKMKGRGGGGGIVAKKVA